MSTTTTNLGLTLPAGTDPADIAVLNTNFGLIDTFAGQQTAKDTSQDARITALETSDTTQNGRLTALETSDTSQSGRLTALETSDTTQNSRLTAIETKNTAQDDRLTAIEAKDTAQDGRLTTLEQTDTAHAARLTAIEAKDTAQDTTIAKLVDAGAKNLLKITGTSRTINGVTFTVNSDGTVTANGTNNSTSSATFVLMPYQEADKIPNGSYRLTGCPSAGSSTTYDLRWYLYSPGKSAYDTGNGAVVEKNGTATGSGGIAIVVKAGQTVDNVVFKPMLCTAEDHAASDAFVPYTPTLRDLYGMIQELQAGGGTT